VVDITWVIGGLAVICALLALVMLFAQDALTCALALLGILLGTAGIYAVMGEHFIATIQLVVYAGAIMVLFVFSIMLLNVHKSPAQDFSRTSPRFFLAAVSALALYGVGAYALVQFAPTASGTWTQEMVTSAGGNTRVLAHALFSRHYIAFEAVSLALIVALVGAVTLAKRKLN
jgi:NADH-quinone oxidoreductase subunit J